MKSNLWKPSKYPSRFKCQPQLCAKRLYAKKCRIFIMTAWTQKCHCSNDHWWHGIFFAFLKNWRLYGLYDVYDRVYTKGVACCSKSTDTDVLQHSSCVKMLFRNLFFQFNFSEIDSCSNWWRSRTTTIRNYLFLISLSQSQ